MTANPQSHIDNRKVRILQSQIRDDRSVSAVSSSAMSNLGWFDLVIV